jgi:hypothetical protein
MISTMWYVCACMSRSGDATGRDAERRGLHANERPVPEGDYPRSRLSGSLCRASPWRSPMPTTIAGPSPNTRRSRLARRRGIERDRLRHSSTAWLRWSRCTGKTSNAGPPKSTKRCRSIRTLRRPCRSEWRCISIWAPPSGDPRPRTGHAARSVFHPGLSAPSRCGPYHRRRIRNGSAILRERILSPAPMLCRLRSSARKTSESVLPLGRRTVQPAVPT